MAASRSAALVSILILSMLPAGAHSRHEESWKVASTKTRTETIPVETARRIVVDDLNGDIRVRGYDGADIKMSVTETIRARDDEAADLARREVSLDVRHEPGEVTICADGPFRESGDCTEWCRHCRGERDYAVVYDLDLQIPREIDLQVRTVEGDIDVAGVKGRFRVSGVNGSVTMSGIRGSGDAKTVNGPVKVSFDENPTEDCEFHTVNGELDVSFKNGLSADMTFKTMNGDVLTDFDYETLAPSPMRVETSKGRTKFRLDATTGIRVASGGPRFEFENINGNILVRRNQ